MNDAFKSWHIPLSAEAKAEAIKRITERHQLLLEVGPVAFAALGRSDFNRIKEEAVLHRGQFVPSRDYLE